jgi:hypothetical protein
VGTDTSWLETPGPVVYADNYNGMTYDARLETPGWTTSEYNITDAAIHWTPLLSSKTVASFKLNRYCYW